MSLRRPPRITITCACDAKLLVPYGERQRCECGLTWDTAQIPVADYTAVRSSARRFRKQELAFVVGAIAVAGALVYVGRTAPLLVTIPAFALAWTRFFRPWWRQRKRAAIQGLPTWEVRPEPGPEAR